MPFRVVLSLAEEGVEGSDARDLAQSNAFAKVRGAVMPADASPGAFVLGTDTVVVVDGRIMGKPSSADEAADMLGLLSGRTHQVVSGVALVRGAGGPACASAEEESRRAPGLAGCSVVDCSVTDVTFRALESADIDAYIATGEWKDKAGAYAIQGIGGLLVVGVRGEYSNVVGLPLGLLARMFRELGFDVLRRSWA